MDFKRTEATRYLCAAAHLDSVFRGRIIREFLENPYKAIGPSHGIDASVVAKHCIAARRNQFILDGLLLLLLAASYSAFRILEPPVATILVASFVILSFVVVFVDRIRLRRFAMHHLLKSNFTPDVVNTPDDNELRLAVEQLMPNPDYNLVVYSGFKPFVGSGVNLRGFSFVLDLSRGKESTLVSRESPKPVSIEELYEEVTTGIKDLALEDLRIDDRLYANGKDIRHAKLFLSDPTSRPNMTIPPDRFQMLKSGMGHLARHYRCVRIVAWDGELVSSAFFRFAKPNDKLFVEVNFFLLCPVAQRYRQIDSWNRPTHWRDMLQMLIEAGLLTILDLIRSPFSTGSYAIGWVLRGHRHRVMKREVLRNPDFDYGASTTIREIGSANEFDRYFQKLDSEMFLKLTEAQILNSLAESLDRRGIDTSEIKERQSAILNNGVIITGGSVSSESIAAGSGAKAIINRISTISGSVAASTASPSQ